MQRQKQTPNPAVFEKENVSQSVPCHGLITEGVIVRSHEVKTMPSFQEGEVLQKEMENIMNIIWN